MLSLLRGAFQRCAKLVKANSRSKIMVYQGVIIGVSAAAAAATCFSGNNYYVIKNHAVEKEEEELELEAFRDEEFRKLRKAFFDPHITDDGTVVFPPMNGRTLYQMVCDYEEEEEKNKNDNKDDLELKKKIAADQKDFKSPVDYSRTSLSFLNSTIWCGYLHDKLIECKKFPPSARCDLTRQAFTSDCGGCGATKIDYKIYAERRLENQAKLRGMNTTEFLNYARHEKYNCKQMCEKCKKFPIPPDCDQEKVNIFCRST